MTLLTNQNQAQFKEGDINSYMIIMLLKIGNHKTKTQVQKKEHQ